MLQQWVVISRIWKLATMLILHMRWRNGEALSLSCPAVRPIKYSNYQLSKSGDWIPWMLPPSIWSQIGVREENSLSESLQRREQSRYFLSDYNSLSIRLLVIFLLLRRSRLEGYILFYNCCLEGLLPWLSLTATTCPPKHRPRPGSPVGIILRYSVWGVFHSFLWINFSKES